MIRELRTVLTGLVARPQRDRPVVGKPLPRSKSEGLVALHIEASR
jgi:hypothetical protein